MHTIKNRIYPTVILPFIAIIYLLSTNNLYGYSYCECSKKTITPEQKFKGAFAVFTGKVKKIRRLIKSDEKLVHFSVIDSWKGVRKENFTVRTGVNDIISFFRKKITCDASFEVGKKYMVFSYLKNNRSKLSYTSNCGNIIPFEEKEKFADHIAILGKPKWHFPIVNIKPINVNEFENMDPVFQESLKGFSKNRNK